jgi:hypothetical protein
MKIFEACPGCGAEGERGLSNVYTNVYYCDDCNIYFCLNCSNPISHGMVSGTTVCRNHVRYTKEHNTRLVGQYHGKFIRY